MDERTNALPVGTEIEGYRILALLGAGGFGITYRAIDLLLDRPVAIKEYLPSVLANRGADRKTVRPFGRQEAEQFGWGLERFRTEAKTLVAFQHPNIVPVHRYFESHGTGYLVMAFQDGKSLADVIDAVGTLSEDEVLTILRPLAAGLADVHAKGFLHRDIKPGNIIIRRDGTPVLIDFGSARQAVTRNSRGLTAIVTEGYAPYEQYETDSNQGPWSDVYALGAVLYHCVTGKRPTEAPKRIVSIVRKQPDPLIPASQAARGQYSESLLAAVDRALAVEEEKRPQNVREFMGMVEGTIPVSPPPDSAAGEAAAAVTFMVEPPSQLDSRRRTTPAPPAPVTEDYMGNIAVDPPSSRLERLTREPPAPGAPPRPPSTPPRDAKPPTLPLGQPETAPVAATPPTQPARNLSGPMAEPAPSAADSHTMMVGGQTILVGGNDRAPAGMIAPEATSSTDAASAVAATRAPGRDAARPAATPAGKRRMLPIAAGVAAALAVGGVAAGYWLQGGPAAPKPRADLAPAAPGPGTPAVPPGTPPAAPPTAAPAPPAPDAAALLRSKTAAPERIWQHLETKARDSQDVVRRIFLLPDDRLAIVGGRVDSGSASTAWVWRFNAKDGKPEGERRTFPNARFDTPNAAALLPDGGLLLAAARTVPAPANPTLTTINAWIARLDAKGEPAWQYTFANRQQVIPYAVAALPGGDVIVVGTVTAGDKSQGWAARISADGKTVVWDKLFGTSGDDSLTAVAVLPDGGTVAVGWTAIVRGDAEDRNLWILRLDANGGALWEKKDIGEQADEKGKAVIVAADGDILVLAETRREPPPPPAPAPGRPQPVVEALPVPKPWLLRLAPDGAPRWNKQYSGGKDDKPDALDAVVALADGGFLLAGSTEAKGAGAKDGWLVRVDGQGAVLWESTLGGTFDDEFSALAWTVDGGIIVGGATAATGDPPAAAPGPNPGPNPGATPPAPAPPAPARPRPAAPAQAEAKLWIMRLGYK